MSSPSKERVLTPPRAVPVEGKENDTLEWRQWRRACSSLVPDVGDVYPPDFRTEPADYGGRFLIRVAKKKAYHVTVIDNGWEAVEPGELDEDGDMARDAYGEDCIDVYTIDLATGEKATGRFTYWEEQIPGVAYAVSRALEEGESLGEPGEYGNFVLRELAAVADYE